MFNKILIANRGEIACRIIRTARQMGIQTVAIYSTADKTSQHVLLADEAYWAGDAPAQASYLNSNAIIELAKLSGAMAIHPGYGFLSENPQFATACEEANIVFIGPSVAALRAMASKQLAKQLLEKTAVPLTPGYHGKEQHQDHLLAESQKIGFPVLLKAAAGGGGKGMRAVYSADEFVQSLASAKREAMASFADDTMIIEKLVTNPRHIEVQIMADNHGEVVHLFERDCSIQRRHQKIIEEAPAPAINPQTRTGLLNAACEVARSIAYRGAGTVEFLVDSAGHFYFMEMNTRLQVEHPVTEMITGFDLVAWQIKIAANQPLPCKQENISSKGHAIECRIYAEDPAQGFIPSIGQLHFLQEPAGTGIRIDSGVVCGSSISQYYDPMIAKLITWGETREQAVLRMQQALTRYAVGGVKTNIAFLQAICAHPRFLKGKTDTGFLAETSISLPEPNIPLALMMAASHDYLALAEKESDPLFISSFGWQMHLKSSWYQTYIIEEKPQELKITPLNTSQFIMEWDSNFYTLSASHVAGRLLVEDGKQQQSAWVESLNGQLHVYLDNAVVAVKPYRWQPVDNQSGHNKNQLTAPMPATVVAILKNQGDTVKKGEPLLVLEAMKMEHTIHAPREGILTKLFYAIGSQVNEGAELLTIQDCE